MMIINAVMQPSIDVCQTTTGQKAELNEYSTRIGELSDQQTDILFRFQNQI